MFQSTRTSRDNELLKQLAEKLQMSQAEVISRALERYAEQVKK